MTDVLETIERIQHRHSHTTDIHAATSNPIDETLKRTIWKQPVNDQTPVEVPGADAIGTGGEHSGTNAVKALDPSATATPGNPSLDTNGNPVTAPTPETYSVAGSVAEKVWPVTPNHFYTSQAAISVQPTKVMLPNVRRASVTIQNLDGANAVTIGYNSGVQTFNGFPIPPGASLTLAITCEVWAICAAGNPIIAMIETVGN